MKTTEDTKSTESESKDREAGFGEAVGSAPVMQYKELTPEQWSFIRGQLQAGEEYARECLADHDRRLGRSMRKNRAWAEQIEADILEFKRAYNLLQNTEVSNGGR